MRGTQQEEECLQLVLGKAMSAGVDVDTRFADCGGATPLMLAAEAGNLLVLKALLHAGADLRCGQCRPKGLLPFFAALLSPHLGASILCCWHCASLLHTAVLQVA